MQFEKLSLHQDDDELFKLLKILSLRTPYPCESVATLAFGLPGEGCPTNW